MKIPDRFDLPAENPYGHRKKLEWILSHINGHSRQSIVMDFGCGNGMAVTRHLARRFNLVLGIESDLNCRTWAQSILPDCFFYPSIGDHGFRRDIDVVIAADVIEHLPNPFETMTAIGRLQQPGALLIGSVPNGRGAFEIEQRLYKTALGPWLSRTLQYALNSWSRPLFDDLSEMGIPYSNAPHVQFFSLNTLRDLARVAGYEMTQVQPGVLFGSEPITATLLYKSNLLMKWNASIATHLPLRMAATWLFVWVKRQK